MSIELWGWPTPNGRKISVALEEMGLPYTIKVVNISKGEQFAPEFLAISPNNKIPAIIDPDGPDGKPISATRASPDFDTSNPAASRPPAPPGSRSCRGGVGRERVRGGRCGARL